MKKLLILALFIPGICGKAYSQNRTFIGGGVSITNDKYELVDPNGGLAIGPLTNGTFGLIIGQELSNTFVVETGFIKKQYSEGFHFKAAHSYGSLGSLTSVQIPLRLKYRLPIYRQKVFFTSTAGYVLGLNSSYYPDYPGSADAINGWGTQTIGNDSYDFSFGTRLNFRENVFVGTGRFGIRIYDPEESKPGPWQQLFYRI